VRSDQAREKEEGWDEAEAKAEGDEGLPMEAAGRWGVVREDGRRVVEGTLGRGCWLGKWWRHVAHDLPQITR
jgi:hypothetical protein